MMIGLYFEKTKSYVRWYDSLPLVPNGPGSLYNVPV